MYCRTALFTCVALAGSLLSRPTLAAPPTVEFNRDVRPILSDHCYACHGPDKNQRKGDLRLDTEEDSRAVLTGKADENELVKRITHADAKKRMPPARFGKPLSQREIETLRLWVQQGAKYQKHWSLLSAQRPPLPELPKDDRPANAIDPFILARLHAEGITPAPEADKRTLIRRLSFDLLGLPPTPEEVDAFLADQTPQAYEKVVDRLLASKHYGERMALYWLDMVRFADTAGYHSDNHRDVTLYRDYVINAFNDNKRFDRFTTEQLAGDLLPNPTVETRIASGYNRLLMTTEEGGAQAKEYLAKYAADRVRNASVVWLGLTMGCAECHDHKFDPVGTKDFYRFAAFWADVKEAAVGRQQQERLPTDDQVQKLKQIDEQLAEVQKEITTLTPKVDEAQAEWEKSLKDKGTADLPKDIAAIVALEAAKRTDKQKQSLTTYYRGISPLLVEQRKRQAGLTQQKTELERTIPATLITTAVAPRMMRVLPRGNWLDDSGEVVAPGVPASLAPAMDIKDRRATRLDLAQWLTAAENPLVARVFVNRMWKLMFGQGLVKSLDDFGAQGTWPTHPELLDWLAVEFRDSGWDVKKLVKLMVMSNTYRQSSLVSEQLRQRDPYNLLLARQGRFRIDAEMVRDNALAVSGLLVKKVGGVSVRPYQPAGYWSLLNFPRREYQNDHGEEQYRRGVYTYWCRTFPHPSLTTFDAPSREECTVERPRSNTPLQALVLLNDPSYVEAARALAERVMRDGGEARVAFAYRQVLCRKPSAEETKIVEGLYQKHLQQFQADKKAAEALLKVGDRPTPPDIDAAELAAWTSVARVLLNLHETITRN